MNTKQVIVFRKDLLKGEHSIRKGKFAAQVAHASIASLLQYFEKKISHPFTYTCDDMEIDKEQTLYEYRATFTENSILNDWLNGKFTKVVVSVDNEEQLLKLKEELDKTYIAHALITDCGLTEFNGVPTNTCLGIGPYAADELDKYTGHLNLL